MNLIVWIICETAKLRVSNTSSVMETRFHWVEERRCHYYLRTYIRTFFPFNKKCTYVRVHNVKIQTYVIGIHYWYLSRFDTLKFDTVLWLPYRSDMVPVQGSLLSTVQVMYSRVIHCNSIIEPIIITLLQFNLPY